MRDIDAISGDVIDIALRIHRELGPGLLESVYETVLAGKLVSLDYKVDRQRPIDIEFEGQRFPAAFRVDLLVDERLIVEIKCVDALNNAHLKQLQTYLRLTKQPVGLLINFAGATLKEGLRRVVNDHIPSASPRLRVNQIQTGRSLMFDLSGKTALVTGASGGLGSAIVKALIAQGATVAVSGSNEAKLRDFAAGIGDKAIPLVCNLSDAEAVDALVPQAVEALGGKLDILINNAGVTRDNLAMRMKDEEFTDVIKVNLEAAFRLMRAAMKPMMRARHGRIINITSVVGVTGNPGQANYVASKAGLIGMTKAFAQEVASRGITANCVAPGFMTSAMTDALTDAQKEGILSRIPTGAMGSGDDIGAAVVYLASDEAGYVTGQTLHVNGGMAMP